MEKRTLGRSGLDITILTFGCWQAGGSGWNDTDDENSIAAMRAGYEAGINFFDTAEGYGDGHSETLVGRFLRETGATDVAIATKVGDGNLAAAKLRAACEASLKRLGQEKIDLYQIHWPSGTWGTPIIPIQETMEELVKLQGEGKVGAIGVSNFNGAQIEEALQFGRIDSLQPPYSLFFQPYEQNGTIDVCRKNGIGVIPYSPLAQGLLTGKFNMQNRPTDNRGGNQIFKDPIYGLALEAVEKLKPIAQKYGATTGNLSLAWLTAQPGVTSPIVGARNAEQITDTAKAATLKIDAADLKQISEIAGPVLASLSTDKTNPWK
ncbi:putative oxidoreductase [Abditibacterium utsteinense]|uniref:Putative oxidoreductase n=1 Tax=Abditibacterium utsteinense TaxID=1960156 RepID=A0A2S8SSG1_9BACT|nr:aldo/keto reductase [Abditibacterium utsteinense]PQV63740.1 putative oxidoreductase [Abditibacterium utsteinense]